jgi:hypothetical protein
VKRLALLCLAAFALAGPVGAAAHAATSPATTVCRNKIINEWEGTGRIRTTYPVACYRAALAYVKGKADLSTYSSIADDIRAALAARQARAAGQTTPRFVGKPIKHHTTTSATGAGPVTGGGGGAGSGGGPGSGGSGSGSPGSGGTGVAAPASSSGGSGTPLPVLILGGVAIVLVAAGAIGTGVRHARRRSA